MTYTKVIRILPLTFALIMSLLSFSGYATNSLPETITTELIVKGNDENKRFSIHFFDVDKHDETPFLIFFTHSFNSSKRLFETTSSVTFKTYLNKSFTIKTKRTYTEHVIYQDNKILYDHTVV